MFKQPNLLLGILDGYFSVDPTERRCNVFRWSGCRDVNSWKTAISGIANVDVKCIPVSEIDNSFAIIFNPFGEAYPDKPSSQNNLPGYEMIRDYIFNGGVFVSAGGLPFTSFYDVTSGQEIKASKVIRNVPISIRLLTIQGIPQIEILGTTFFHLLRKLCLL